MTEPRIGRRPRRALIVALGLLLVPATVALAEWRHYESWSRPHGTIEVAGETREYRVYAPATRDTSRPAPLVISIHGAGIDGGVQEQGTQWNRVADEHGFIVAYPSGVRGSGPPTWRVRADPELARDIRFIAELIDTLSARYAIDSTRIYIDGLSNGGGMAFVLSCAIPDRIAAVGTVAAAQTLPWSWCADARPVPFVSMHGTGDVHVPYGGGLSRRVRHVFPSVPVWVASWAARNGCAAEPETARIPRGITRLEYRGCDAPVVHYRIEGGGHVLPGGRGMPAWYLGADSSGLNAAAELWKFYEGQRR